MTTMPDEDRQRAAFAEQHPGWEAWKSIKGGQWHCRKMGSEPPVMLHDNNPEGLHEQVCSLEGTPYLLP